MCCIFRNTESSYTSCFIKKKPSIVRTKQTSRCELVKRAWLVYRVLVLLLIGYFNVCYVLNIFANDDVSNYVKMGHLL